MLVKLLVFAGSLELHIRYTLEPVGQATRVSRDVSFQLPGMLKVAQLIIVSTVCRESERRRQVMKRTVETRPEDDNQ
jgi:hypothetical protein